MAGRQDSCADREGPGKRGGLDNKTHSYASDLLLDQGRQTGRPAQVGTAFCDNRKHRQIHLNRMLEDDGEISSMELHRLIVKKFGKQIPVQTIRQFLRQKLIVGHCEDENWPHDLRQE